MSDNHVPPTDTTPPAKPVEPAPPTTRQQWLGVLIGLTGLIVPMLIVAWLLASYSATEELVISAGNGQQLLCAAVSPNGQLIAAGGNDTTLRVWDAGTGQVVHELKGHVGSIHCLAFTPNGRQLLSGGLDRLFIWDVASGRQAGKLDSPTNFIQSLALSEDGKLAVTASQADRLVRVWDLAARKQVLHLEGHTEPVRSVACVGRRVLSGGNTTVRLWDLDTGKELLVLKGHIRPVHSVALAPDGLTAASGSAGGTIRVWDLTKGTELMALRGPAAPVVSLAFSPDGARLVSGSLGKGRNPEDEKEKKEHHTLRLWNVQTGLEAVNFQGLQGTAVWSVRLTADGRRVISAGGDGKVRVWRLP